MMMARIPRLRRRLQIAAVVCLLLLATIKRAGAQTQAQPCPLDRTLLGYTSLETINEDMKTEQARIAEGGVPEDGYTFTLCPETVFDASSAPLMPLLSGASFVCGKNGSRSDNCILSGGSVQVLIEDSTVESFPLEEISFLGLSFQGFSSNDEMTGTSIQASASSTTKAIFRDVEWTDFNANFVVRQIPRDRTAEVQIIGALLGNGSTGDVFANDAGVLQLSNLEVQGLTAVALVSTGNGGTSFIEDSIVTDSDMKRVTSTTNGAAQSVKNTEVTAMQYLEEAFYAEGSGSNLAILETLVRDNKLGNAPWSVVNVGSSAVASVSDTRILNNAGLMYGAIATGTGSSVSLIDSVLEGNSGRGDSINPLVMGLAGANVSLERVEMKTNTEFTAAILVLLSSSLNIAESCIQDSTTKYVVFVDSGSDFVQSKNFIGDYESEFCPATAPRLFKESPNSGCFTTGDCDGTCQVVAAEDQCTIPTVAPTPVPTLSPTFSPTSQGPTFPPTTSPTNQPTTPLPIQAPTPQPFKSPTSEPTESSTSLSPISAPNSAPASPTTSTPTVPVTPSPTHKPHRIQKPTYYHDMPKKGKKGKKVGRKGKKTKHKKDNLGAKGNAESGFGRVKIESKRENTGGNEGFDASHSSNKNENLGAKGNAERGFGRIKIEGKRENTGGNEDDNASRGFGRVKIESKNEYTGENKGDNTSQSSSVKAVTNEFDFGYQFLYDDDAS